MVREVFAKHPVAAKVVYEFESRIFLQSFETLTGSRYVRITLERQRLMKVEILPAGRRA